MKVGDYVKFKDKRGNTYIRKVIDGYKAHWYGCKVDKEANNVPYVSAKNIIKSSPNIIDLIEVGDYVNGEKITRIVPPDLCGDEELTDKKVYINDFEVYEEWIKSIVTKEQFSQNEYRIGE